MRVGLIGFGRTGRSVASVLLRETDVTLAWVVRRSERLEYRPVGEVLGEEPLDEGVIYCASAISASALLDLSPVDVILDFSSADGLEYYGDAAAERGVAIVSAVSHYGEIKQRDLRRLARRTRVLWSPNITLGINFMMLAAQTLQRIDPSTDIQIVEEHFRTKSGVSGTATRLADALGLTDSHVHSVRAGGIIGVHELLFGFPAQTVRLRHEAISRDAFGDGAVFAARHLVAKPIGLYRMEELLLPYFSGEGLLTPPMPMSSTRWRRRAATSLRNLASRVDTARATSRARELPAALDPFIEVRALLANSGGSAVTGPNRDVTVEDAKEPVLN